MPESRLGSARCAARDQWHLLLRIQAACTCLARPSRHPLCAILHCVNLNVRARMKMLGYAALWMLPFGTPAARVTFVSVLCSAGATAFVHFTIAHLFRAVIEGEVADAASARQFVAEHAPSASARGANGTPDIQPSGEPVEQKPKCNIGDLVAAARAAGVAGAGLYSFSPLVWMYSVQAEVFSLNNLFVAALVFLTTLYLVPGAQENPRAENKNEKRAEDAAEAHSHRQGMAKADQATSRSVTKDRRASDTQKRLSREGTRQVVYEASHADDSDGQPQRIEQTLVQALRDAGMREHRLLVSPGGDGKTAGHAGGFYWGTENSDACEVLMVIIPGSGSSLAGLWSSVKLLVEYDLDVASVAPYVRSARRRGWGVILMCPNANFELDSPYGAEIHHAERDEVREVPMTSSAVGKGAEHELQGGFVQQRQHRPRARALRRAALPGSENAEAHAVSVWEQVVRPTSAKVVVVAHSTGGVAALHVASTFPREFASRVRALALLGEARSLFSLPVPPWDQYDLLWPLTSLGRFFLPDSVHKTIPGTEALLALREFCYHRARNFVASPATLGDARPKPWHKKVPVVEGGCVCISGGHTDHLRVPAAAVSGVFDFLDSLLLPETVDKVSGAKEGAAGDCQGGACGTAETARREGADDSIHRKRLVSQERWSERRAAWIPYAGALIIGLGITNQHTIVLAALPLALAILCVGRRKLFRWGAFLTLVGCGLIGMIPYVYLVSVGDQPQRGAWGDPATLEGLVKHVLRSEYGTFKLFAGSDGQEQGLQSLTTGLWLYLHDLPQQQLLLGPIIVLIGVVKMLSAGQTRALGITLLAAWAGYTVVFHTLANLPLAHTRHGELFRSVHARFWLQPNTILATFLGFGMLSVMRGVVAVACFGCCSARVRQGACWALAAALLLLQIVFNYGKCDKSREWAVWEAGRATLLSVPKGGLLLVKGDLNTNAVRYLMECEGARPDVQQLDLSHISYAWFNRRHARLWHSNITLPGRRFTRLHRNPPKGAYLLRHLLRTNARRMPIVITSGLESLDPGIFEEFVLWPSGSAYRVYPRLEPPALRPWLRDNALRLPLLASDYVEAAAHSGEWEDIATRDSAIAHAQVASHMLMVAPPESSSSSTVPCRISIPADLSPARGPTTGREEDAAAGYRRRERDERRGQSAASWNCSVVKGRHVATGDKCNIAFLQACQGVLHGDGAVDRLHWFACAAQALVCIATSMADPPALVWKNAAAALEQMQLLSQDVWLERTKLTVLSRYAFAEICVEAQAHSSSGNSSVTALAGDRVAQGGAELLHIVEILAASGLPVPCLEA